MYAVTSIPFESRTRATFRSAEFGFFGVIVLTTVQTPRFCGHPCMAGCFGLDFCTRRGFFVNWLIVGIPQTSPSGSRYSSENEARLPGARRKKRPLSHEAQPSAGIARA